VPTAERGRLSVTPKTILPPPSFAMATQYSIKESKWNFIDIQSALENHLQEMFPSCSKWQIWGNSLGGWLAIDFYSRNPVKFYKVVAFNPVGLDLEVPLLKNVFNSPTGAKMRDLHERTFAQPLELPNFFWSFLAWGLSLAGEKIPAGKSDFALDPFLNRAPNKLPIHIVWGQSDRLIPHFLPEFKKYSKKMFKLNSNLEKICVKFAVLKLVLSFLLTFVTIPIALTVGRVTSRKT
jgi:pimeloyl-ACP methyl ester carboxylesterase